MALDTQRAKLYLILGCLFEEQMLIHTATTLIIMMIIQHSTLRNVASGIDSVITGGDRNRAKRTDSVYMG
eukprot:1603259-Heterocapsa_arctica.AAC.1